MIKLFTRLGLLSRIIIAIILGVSFGLFLPLPVIRIFSTFNAVFSELLSFSIPLIIFSLVASAISDVGSKASKMLLITTAIAYGSTIFAGYLSFFTGTLVFPLLLDKNGSTDLIADNIESVTPYFSISMPPVFGVMTALVLAFMLGLGMAYQEPPTLRRLTHEAKEIVSSLISSLIIPLLPLYILGIFMGMSYSGEAIQILRVFINIVGVIFVLHIALLLLQFIVAGVKYLGKTL